ncbi:MAG TPA: hypothetical protein VN922_19170, partial [Bacteroidia bacterium]|nr:hypothetical protein [Bacteroidia bacterium]
MTIKKTYDDLNGNYYTNKVFLFLLIVILLPFFILSFYNHPYADDLFVTYMEWKYGLWGSIKYWYTSVSGRYFSLTIESLNPIKFGAYWAYKLNAIILIILLLVSIYWLSGKLFKSLGRSGKIGITFLIVFPFIMLMPDVYAGIFYQNTICQIFLPEIMTVFLLGCIISYYTSTNKKTYFILSCILAIAIIGSYEINMVYVDLVIALIAFIRILKRKNLTYIVALLIVCFVFSIIEIRAHGNSTRAYFFFPNQHNFSYSIREAVIYSAVYLIPWVPFM